MSRDSHTATATLFGQVCCRWITLRKETTAVGSHSLEWRNGPGLRDYSLTHDAHTPAAQSNTFGQSVSTLPCPKHEGYPDCSHDGVARSSTPRICKQVSSSPTGLRAAAAARCTASSTRARQAFPLRASWPKSSKFFDSHRSSGRLTPTPAASHFTRRRVPAVGPAVVKWHGPPPCCTPRRWGCSEDAAHYYAVRDDVVFDFAPFDGRARSLRGLEVTEDARHRFLPQFSPSSPRPRASPRAHSGS